MTDYSALRASLIAESEALAKRVKKIGAHLRGVDRDTPDDWTDRAQFQENDEVLEGLEGHDRAELLRIRAALKRIDEGTYGVCASCGDDIPVARLKAVPTTALCVGCAP
jgi:RNA polymerase-binding protein DksA